MREHRRTKSNQITREFVTQQAAATVNPCFFPNLGFKPIIPQLYLTTMFSTSSTSFTCKGCSKTLSRLAYLEQHWSRTKNQACKKASQAHSDAIRRSSSSAPQRNPRPAARPHPRTPSPNQLPIFAGDAFGDDYTEANFPGFEDNPTLPESSEDTDLPRDSESDITSDESEFDNDGVEAFWERQCPHASVTPLDVMDVEAPVAPAELPTDSWLPQRPAVIRRYGGRVGEVSDPPSTGNAAAVSEESRRRHLFATYEKVLKEGGSLEGSGKEDSDARYYPFRSKRDYEIALWAILEGCGSNAFTKFLSTEGVSNVHSSIIILSLIFSSPGC
jgi:hypothetical protein